MNKHYTFQEWLEECQSYQDTYEKYFEMQKELENLNEKLITSNEHLARSIKDYEELLLEKNNIIDKAIEYMEADYINGAVDGLSWLEVQKLLKILKGEE